MASDIVQFICLVGELLMFIMTFICLQCLQCFDAVGWAAGRASGL